MAKVAIQGGVKNYLGNQKTVGNVPLKWQSGPDAPDTELAYITKAEKNLLLKKDLHGSLKNGPNTGPEGIMSLDSQGDKGTYGDTGQGYGDRQTSDKSAEDVSASRNRTAADKKQRADLLAGKLGYQNDPNNQNRSKSELGKAYTKGAYNSFGFGTRLGMYDKQYKAGVINRMREKKKNAIRNLVLSRRSQKYNPSIDVDEIVDNIMNSYNVNTKTFDNTKFTSGLNKGFDFDLNKLDGPMLGPLGLSPNSRFTKDGKSVPLGTNYLDTTPDLTSHPSTTPSIIGQILGKVSPMNQNTLKSTLNRINQLDNIALGGVTQSEITDYYDRAQGKGKYDIFGGDGGDGQQPYLPINYNTGAATTEAVEPYTNDFTYRFGDDQDVIYDNYGTQGYRTTAAEGGIMGTRARRAMGGIMNRVDQRQQFFLGGIGKAIKGVVGGVVDATKKVLKSDLGKAALAGAAFYYAPAMFGGTTGFGAGSTYGNFARGLGQKALLKGGTGAFELGNLSLGKIGALGLGALGLFGNEAAPNEMNFSDRGGRLKNSQGQEGNQAIRDEIYEAYESGDQDKIMQLQKFYGYKLPALNAVQDISLPSSLPYPNYAEGGRIGKAEGGLMDLGGMEKDYRAEGGFVPIGEYEKKDDVPARLSVNEFVMTADAVRGAGQGDIDKGAEIMENMMENLENGGTVSKESQGNKGAQNMFKTSERLGAVI